MLRLANSSIFVLNKLNTHCMAGTLVFLESFIVCVCVGGGGGGRGYCKPTF